MRLLLGGVLVLTPFVSVPPGPDKMLEYGLYQNEQILAACAVNEGKAGHAVYDTTVIIDMDHGSLGKMRKAPKEFLNKYIQPLNDYYPETMFKTIVVNAPTWMKVSPPPSPSPLQTSKPNPHTNSTTPLNESAGAHRGPPSSLQISNHSASLHIRDQGVALCGVRRCGRWPSRW